MSMIGRLFPRSQKRSSLHAALLPVILSISAVGAHAQIVPPAGLPDQGQLRLQMGTPVESGPGAIGHVPRRFVHAPSGLQQQIAVTSKCILQFAGPYSLAGLSSTGGNGSGDIGVGPDSLGVP
ncbi:MAG: hypothetical protein KJO13_11660, partial [Gammaproteobacteria bacterium]|nr:hypothetical protein [Gammaproteobacteria bacterium]